MIMLVPRDISREYRNLLELRLLQLVQLDISKSCMLLAVTCSGVYLPFSTDLIYLNQPYRIVTVVQAGPAARPFLE